MPKRRYTKELLKAQAEGRTIVTASGVMYYPGSPSHEWPVVYRPRYTTDSRPWLAVMHDGSLPADGSGIRYSGRECTVESRFVIVPQKPGCFLVRDLVHDSDATVFVGDGVSSAYRKAELYIINLNRNDRRPLMGLPQESAA
jgi:hypothetical protein